MNQDQQCTRCGGSGHPAKDCGMPVVGTLPLAHRLANALDSDPSDITGHKAAAELRRQHAEIERLTSGLKQANAQAERFEREWYLRGDAIERKDALLREAVAIAEEAQSYTSSETWSPSMTDELKALCAAITKELQ